MTEHWASGSWQITPGKEEEFVQRWTEFLSWTRENREGFNQARLLKDHKDPQHFVSVAEWESPEARAGWQNDPGFPERMGACRALCTDFYGSDYTLAATR